MLEKLKKDLKKKIKKADKVYVVGHKLKKGLTTNFICYKITLKVSEVIKCCIN